MQIFLFKYYNNIIGLNSRVAHFNRDITAECTLCNIDGPRPAAAETLQHLFFSCLFAQKLLRGLPVKYFFNVNIPREVLFWGIISENEKENICATIIFYIFQYLIWQAKLEKKIPTESEFFNNLEYKLTITCNSSNKINQLFRECKILSMAGDGVQRVPGGP
jgi:hypothetical protein